MSRSNDEYKKYRNVEGFGEEEANEILKKGYSKAEDMLEEPDRVEELLNQIEEKLKLIPKIGKTLAIVPSMISLVRDYIHKKYSKAPVGTIIAIISALIYMFNPLDVIPDVLPGVGYIDDALVIGVCIKLIRSDLNEYQVWKSEKKK